MTDGSQVSNKFLQKLAEKRAAEEAANQQQQNDLLQWAEFIPDIELDGMPGLSDQEKTFDEFISFIRITEAYQRWGGKSQISNPNKEEVKVRCPNPQHQDNDPSFVMNTKKNVFNCFKCGGGDIYDIAAWHFGFPVPGYKDKTHFRNLKDNILADYGYQVHSAPGAEDIIIQVEVPQVIEVSPSTPQATNISYTPEGAAYAEPTLEQAIQDSRQHDSIDWKTIVPENTFMRTYLEATTVDTCPEEYHFWSALVAVGLAAGLNRKLQDQTPVTGNLFVCYTGPTGTGKSRAKSRLTTLIEDNIPYNKDDVVPEGTKIGKNLQSGEVVVKMFQHEIMDISGKGTGKYLPVRMLVNSEELAGIAIRSSRQGNTLKDTLMDIYDCKSTIESHSLANSITAILPFGSVITTTQNKSIRDLISKKDNNSGFVNRWIFATGVSKPRRAIDLTVVDLTRAGGLLRLIKNECSNLVVITWSEDAVKLWTEFFNSRVAADMDKSTDSEIMQRIDLLMKKLFLLFTINNREKILTEDTVRRVIMLYPYLAESYGVIDQQVSATEYGDNEQFIIHTVRRLTQNGRPASTNDIYKAARHRISNTSILRKMLDELCAVGELNHARIPAAGAAGGRPKDVYMPLRESHNVS